MKILTVDDDPHLCMLVERFLKAKGHEVVTAEDGAVGVKVAVRETPDLILMDLNMPVMDGFHATATLKAKPETKDIPVLVLTGEDPVGTYDSFYEAGADGYLTKPIDFGGLLSRITSFD